MLNIDTNTMLIELTRGDSASIVFSAVDSEGTAWHPTAGDKIKFAVAKKYGAEPLSEVVNTYGSDEDAFWTIAITDSFWLDGDEDKYKFKDYVWDVQLTTSTGTDTIIGETGTLHPTFRVLGEVATE